MLGPPRVSGGLRRRRFGGRRSSARISSVDWPSGGAGRSGATGESPSRSGHPGTGTRPRPGCSTYWIMPRWIRCSSVSTSRIDLTGAQGTPAACRSRTSSARVRVLVTATTPASSTASMLATRSFVVRNLGSSISSGRPSAVATPRQCRSEMQMIASQPSLCRVDVVRRDRHARVPVPGALGELSVGVVVQAAQARGQHRVDGVVHRHLDDLPPSGALALEQGRGDRREQVDAAGEVDERGAGLGRRPVGLSGGRGAAGHRLHGDVHGGHVRVGTGGPVALAGGHDQARVARQQPRRAELQALHGARREVLDEHVGGLDQVEQRLAAGVGLQVEHHAALVGVEHHELVGLDRVVRAEAQRLTAGRLDLDHVGAQLCEQQPAVRDRCRSGPVRGPGRRQRPA